MWLHIVQFLLYNHWSPKDAHAHPFRRKAFEVWGVQLFLCSKSKPQDAQAHTFRRKTFYLHTVQLFLHHSWSPQRTHYQTFRREAFGSEQCNYSRNHFSGLKYHMLSHNSVKPFCLQPMWLPPLPSPPIWLRNTRHIFSASLETYKVTGANCQVCDHHWQRVHTAVYKMVSELPRCQMRKPRDAGYRKVCNILTIALSICILLFSDILFSI